VPAADALLLLVKGSDLPATAYKPETPSNPGLCRGCEVTFMQVAPHAPWDRVRIAYRNASSAPRYVELRVNGQSPTAIALPPSGAGWGEISVMVHLDRSGSANVLAFASDSDLTGVFDAINVE